MSLQSFDQFKSDLRLGLRIHLTMNKVTEFAPVELSCRWKRQYESRPRRLSFEEFMRKKKEFLHTMMRLSINE